MGLDKGPSFCIYYDVWRGKEYDEVAYRQYRNRKVLKVLEQKGNRRETAGWLRYMKIAYTFEKNCAILGLSFYCMILYNL